MAAAWPLVKRRLVDLMPDLFGSVTGWGQAVAYDGPAPTQDAPTHYVTVGYVPGEDFGGSYEQTRNGENGWQGALEETGTVRCQVVCWTGDSVLSVTEDAAFALVDAWEVAVSADETLGVLPSSSSASLAVDVEPVQNDAGSAQRLTVTLTYFARGL